MGQLRTRFQSFNCEGANPRRRSSLRSSEIGADQISESDGFFFLYKENVQNTYKKVVQSGGKKRIMQDFGFLNVMPCRWS